MNHKRKLPGQKINKQERWERKKLEWMYEEDKRKVNRIGEDKRGQWGRQKRIEENRIESDKWTRQMRIEKYGVG